MLLELTFSGILLAFFSYCFVLIGLQAPPHNPKIMNAAQWPQLLLGLLIVLLAWNIVKVVRNHYKTKKADLPEGETEGKKITNIPKLLLGMAILFAYAFVLEYIGFIPSTILFVIAYAALLGERTWWKLVIYGLAISLIIYFLFTYGLSIMLPRGYGFFRNFALTLETLI